MAGPLMNTQTTHLVGIPFMGVFPHLVRFRQFLVTEHLFWMHSVNLKMLTLRVLLTRFQMISPGGHFTGSVESLNLRSRFSCSKTRSTPLLYGYGVRFGTMRKRLDLEGQSLEDILWSR